MQRTGMRQTLGLLAAAVMIAACGGDDGGTTDDGSVADRPIDSPFDPPIDAPPIDGPVDGPTDASGCGADIRFIGQYVDWDSTIAGFIGIGGARWTVVGDITRTTLSQPNGLVQLCLDPSAPSQITISGPNLYLPGLFIADPAVFSPAGSRFEARGLRMDQATAQFAEFGASFNTSFAHIWVYKIGAPISLALSPAINPPQRSYISDGPSDTSWIEGDTGTYTLFPNRPFAAGPATLTSTAAFLGPTTLPIASGRFTYTAIR